MPAKTKTVSDLAAHVGGRVAGDGSVVIARVASLDAAGDGDISYVEDEKFFDAARQSHADFSEASASLDDRSLFGVSGQFETIIHCIMICKVLLTFADYSTEGPSRWPVRRA